MSEAALSKPPAVRVLVADRQPMFGESMARAIARDPGQQVVARTVDGYEAIALIAETQPDVAVLEMALRGLDGLAVLSAVVRDELATRVLFISDVSDPTAVYAAVVGGAWGYLTKRSGAEELSHAVAAVAAGGIVIPEEVQHALDEGIRRRARSEEPRIDEATREILVLTAAGCSVREISGQVHLAPSTVKSRLHCLYKALGVSAPTAAVAEALRRHLID